MRVTLKRRDCGKLRGLLCGAEVSRDDSQQHAWGLETGNAEQQLCRVIADAPHMLVRGAGQKFPGEDCMHRQLALSKQPH